MESEPITDLADGAKVCKLPCEVTTHRALPIPPTVTWEKRLSEDDLTYVDIGDADFWASQGISFDNRGNSARCKLASTDPDSGSVIYDCGYFLRGCTLEIFQESSQEFRCIVRTEHTYSQVTQCAVIRG